MAFLTDRNILCCYRKGEREHIQRVSVEFLSTGIETVCDFDVFYAVFSIIGNDRLVGVCTDNVADDGIAQIPRNIDRSDGVADEVVNDDIANTAGKFSP